MKKRTNILKWAGIIALVVIAACALEFVFHYRSHPMKKEKHIQTKGYLVFGTDFEMDEVVDVEIKGEELKYLFSDHEDAVQGTIWVNDQNVFGEDAGKEQPGFYVAFHEDMPEMSFLSVGTSGAKCNYICISKDWDTIVCSLMVDESISKTVETPTLALLILNAETEEEAKEQLEKAMTHPKMKQQLKDIGWDKG